MDRIKEVSLCAHSWKLDPCFQVGPTIGFTQGIPRSDKRRSPIWRCAAYLLARSYEISLIITALEVADAVMRAFRK